MENVPASVFFHGSVTGDQIEREYAASSVLVFPTLCDGFGMVVTEAWSRGLPVLTTPCAGVTDLLRDRENGLLFPARDPEAIAATILGCAERRDELRAMRGAARTTAAAWQWSDYRAALRAAVVPQPIVP